MFLGVTSVSYNILTVSQVQMYYIKLFWRTEENKDKRQCGGKNERRLREKERGVYVSHPANKQKSKHQRRKYCDTWCCRLLLHLPTQVSQKAILLARDKSSAKSQHLSPPGALRDNRERKKAIQHLCLQRLKHVAFSASLPSSLPRGNSTRQKVATVSELSLSRSLSTFFTAYKMCHIILLIFLIILFGHYCGVSSDVVESRPAFAQTEWPGLSSCSSSCVIQV